MTPLETAVLVKLMQVAYPNMPIEQPDKARGIPGTVQFWESALARYENADCLAAVEYFKTHEPKRQFAPGLFEFEDAVRKVVSERNARLRASEDVKRVTFKPGDNPDTFERINKEVGGQVREFIRATRAQRIRVDEEARERGLVKEVFALPGGVTGSRYTVPSFTPPAGKTVHDLVANLCDKKSMPKPEAEDYSERYDWGSVWKNLDEAAAMPMQGDPLIGPEDFKRRND